MLPCKVSGENKPYKISKYTIYRFLILQAPIKTIKKRPFGIFSEKAFSNGMIFFTVKKISAAAQYKPLSVSSLNAARTTSASSL